MEHIETFVTASLHVSPKGAKFIRVRFQADGETWLTGFNPAGVASVEWVQRVSHTTGKQRIQSRFPVRVSFTRSSVVGSDVVAACELAPRDFTPVEMDAADDADISALAGSNNYAGVVYASARLYVTDQAYGAGSRLLRTSLLS